MDAKLSDGRVMFVAAKRIADERLEEQRRNEESANDSPDLERDVTRQHPNRYETIPNRSYYKKDIAHAPQGGGAKGFVHSRSIVCGRVRPVTQKSRHNYCGYRQ